MGNFTSLINKQKYVLLILLFLLSGFSIAYAINTASTGYRVTGSPQTINVHNNCRIARTTSGSNVFAPTRTAAEWNAFIAGKPSNVSLSACAAPCTPWVHTSNSTTATYWYVFKPVGSNSGSFRIWWEQNPRTEQPLVKSGKPYTATSYTIGGYRYERGAQSYDIAGPSSDTASYYIRRCPV